MTKQNEKIYLKDYIRPLFQVDGITLDFDLNEDFCRVTATSKITSQKPGSSLFLDGTDLELVTVQIDSRTLTANEYKIAPDGLTIFSVPEKFELKIETKILPQNNTSLEGLYKSNAIFCTQCEAQGFRKITYFLDRPDVMTKYFVTIEADKKKYPVLLSNGDRVKIEDLGNGRHKASWRDPHNKPCYLFALVAGDLGLITDRFITKSGKTVNLEIYASHGKQERCGHAMDSLKKAMKWDEETYGLEYDLNDYMIVAIDDFNAGAMENKGLNIFNSRLVLASAESATDPDFLAIESVVAHEYFHNWTGNRVTLANWFQLSLKEGLTVFRDQEFSADMTSRSVQRVSDVDSLRERQFPEDSGPNAHPVRPESCMAVDNFFTATIYEKGAEVIRMMQTLVGRKGFRKGMDEYFRRYDGQAVTTDDFAAAILETNGVDGTQFKLWYTQSGTPEVIVSEKYEAEKKEFHLTLAQSCPPTPGQTDKLPFHIPLLFGLLNSRGQEMPVFCDAATTNSDGKNLLQLKNGVERFIFKNISERPVLSILREFSAPILLKWEQDIQDLYFLLQNDTDEFNRREAAQIVSLRVFDSLIKDIHAKRTPVVDGRYIESIGRILLDEQISPAFKDQMLHLPTDILLTQYQAVLDAEAFHQARLIIRQTIASTYKKSLSDIYHRYHEVAPLSREPKVFGHRALKNTALDLLQESGDSAMIDLAIRQYQTAKNMTDQMSALEMLANSEHPFRNTALQDFYDKWKNDSVVLNKWFSTQALSQRPDTLDMVRGLTSHPSFQITNPNNVYSLIRNFTQNYPCFHRADGKSYEFLADMILKVDSKNPQVAARLCSAFNFVKKFTPNLREKALGEIKKVLAHETLSKNSRELLQSALP